MMQKAPLDPDVADSAPNEPALTAYDEQHVVTYIRLLQAEGEGANWREVWLEWSCIWTQSESQTARGAHIRVILRAPSG
ncbi:hypothetical protein ACVWXO_001570 [Bradyrhizobium sp. LM2.7]